MARIIDFAEGAGDLERIVHSGQGALGVCIPMHRSAESKPAETTKPRRQRRKRVIKLDDHRDPWTPNLRHEQNEGGEVVSIVDIVRNIYEEIEGRGVSDGDYPHLYGIVRTEQLDLIRKSEYARIVLRLLQEVENPSGCSLLYVEEQVKKRMGSMYNEKGFYKAIDDMKEADLISPFSPALSIMLHIKFEKDYTGGEELRRLLHMCET